MKLKCKINLKKLKSLVVRKVFDQGGFLKKPQKPENILFRMSLML